MSEPTVSWDYVILQPLSRSEMDLRDLYDAIYEELRDGSVNPHLFDIEPRWGERPRYYHAVRSTMSSLRKRGMVERISRGRHRTTEEGRRRLAEVEP